MSVTITTDIFCEQCSTWDADCGVSGTNRAEARQARRKAKARGWFYVLPLKGRMIDLCPICAEKQGLKRKEKET